MGIFSFDSHLSAQRQWVTGFYGFLWGVDNTGTQASQELRARLFCTQRESGTVPASGNVGPSSALPGGQYLTSSTGTTTWCAFPYIAPFNAGTRGYIGGLRVSGQGSSTSSVHHLALYDYLWVKNSVMTTPGTNAVTGFPTASVLSRSPSGDGKGNVIIVEQIFATTGGPATIQVQYTNSAGVSGRLTEALTINPALWLQCNATELQLQAGDQGVQSIESINTSGTAMANSYSAVVLARPVVPRFPISTGSNTNGYSYYFTGAEIGYPEVYQQSCFVFAARSATHATVPGIQYNMEIVSN